MLRFFLLTKFKIIVKKITEKRFKNLNILFSKKSLKFIHFNE